MPTILERFWSKVSILENGCWEWHRGTNGKGYGQFWDGGRVVPSHRFAFELFNGKIPEGLEPDHLLCVNPNHIEPVTRSENTLRGIGPALLRARQLAKTHCPQGHPYDETNIYYNKRGQRSCQICRRMNSKNGRMQQALKKG